MPSWRSRTCPGSGKGAYLGLIRKKGTDLLSRKQVEKKSILSNLSRICNYWNKSSSNAAKPLSHTANPWKQVLTLPLLSRWSFGIQIWKNTIMKKMTYLTPECKGHSFSTSCTHKFTELIPHILSSVSYPSNMWQQIFTLVMTQVCYPGKDSDKISTVIIMSMSSLSQGYHYHRSMPSTHNIIALTAQ